MICLVITLLSLALAELHAHTEMRNTILDKTYAYDYFLKATYEQYRGDVASAEVSYEKIFELPHPIYAYESYLQLLADTEQYGKFAKIYLAKEPEFLAVFKKNQTLQLCAAQALMATGHEEKASQMLRNLLKQHKNDAEVCYYAAVAYLKSLKINQAIELLTDCLKNPQLAPRAYLFNFLLSKAYMTVGQNDKALASIDKSLKQFPKFDRGWLFKAMLQEQRGNVNEAITGYKQFLDIAGSDAAVEKQLVQLLFSQNRFGEAVDVLKNTSADSGEYYFDLALISLRANRMGEALHYTNQAIEKMPALEKAKLLKVEILARENQHPQLLQFLKKWLVQEPKNLSILHTCQLLKNAGMPILDLIKLFEDVLPNHANPVIIHAMLGDLHMEVKNLSKALESYKAAADSQVNPELRGKILFQAGYILYKQEKFKELETLLAKAEVDGIIYHGLQNLKAFYLAEHTQHYNQALETIDQALVAKPNNPSYLDTKAEILARMGRRKEAHANLKRAKQLSPLDPTVTRHLQELTEK